MISWHSFGAAAVAGGRWVRRLGKRCFFQTRSTASPPMEELCHACWQEVEKGGRALPGSKFQILWESLPKVSWGEWIGRRVRDTAARAAREMWGGGRGSTRRRWTSSSGSWGGPAGREKVSETSCGQMGGSFPPEIDCHAVWGLLRGGGSSYCWFPLCARFIVGRTTLTSPHWERVLRGLRFDVGWKEISDVILGGKEQVYKPPPNLKKKNLRAILNVKASLVVLFKQCGFLICFDNSVLAIRMKNVMGPVLSSWETHSHCHWQWVSGERHALCGSGHCTLVVHWFLVMASADLVLWHIFLQALVSSNRTTLTRWLWLNNHSYHITCEPPLGMGGHRRRSGRGEGPVKMIGWE